MIHRPNLYLAQNISKRILKKEHATSSGTGNIQPPRHLAKLSNWRGGLVIFYIDPIIKLYYKNAFEGYWIPTMLCGILKLILNSDQNLALFRQKHILTATGHKKFTKIVKISLFNYPMLG